LEFAPPKVLGLIPSGANFGGLSPYRACSGFKRGPPQVGGGIGPLGLVGSDTEFSKKKKPKINMRMKKQNKLEKTTKQL